MLPTPTPTPTLCRDVFGANFNEAEALNVANVRLEHVLPTWLPTALPVSFRFNTRGRTCTIGDF